MVNKLIQFKLGFTQRLNDSIDHLNLEVFGHPNKAEDQSDCGKGPAKIWY
jgi:hypothetical protein